jgi:hypothetical protein
MGTDARAGLGSARKLGQRAAGVARDDGDTVAVGAHEPALEIREPAELGRWRGRVRRGGCCSDASTARRTRRCASIWDVACCAAG